MNPELEIDVRSTKELLDADEDILLIDCRELSEWETCKIEGAVLIPMKQTKERLTEIDSFQDKRVVVF